MGKSEIKIQNDNAVPLGPFGFRASSFLRGRAQTTAITREGFYYLFVLAFVFTGAVLREINLMLVLAGMMLGPLVFNWRIARRMIRAVRIERVLPQTVVAGQPATIQYRAFSSLRGCAIGIIDGIDLATGGASTSIATAWFGDLRPTQPAVAASHLIFPTRGLYRLGPLKIQTSYPLGLLRSARRESTFDRLLVLPRLGRLTRRWHLLYDSTSHGEVRQRRQGTVQGDFYGLRDWRSGDSRRHIHWRTSARRGTLMIRQFEQNRNQDLILLIDLWQPNDPAPQDRMRVEQAVSFAATLVNHICRQGGCQLTLAYFDTEQNPQTIAAGASAALGRDLQATLAELPAHHAGTTDQLLAACQTPNRTATVVLVTTRQSPGTSSGELSGELSRLPVASFEGTRSGHRDQFRLVVETGTITFDELIVFEQ